ncbi:thioesterase family protein [Nocardia sp. 2]|uniref:Thioesterase family protein n=1 Tax=Nocardia acididurans TaxID=2802282 RepID=A0ABS1MA69_9NOCA|nr:acyl-CoA thioesterase domain-containing protein [Nocardia acididurans]MBL1077522.1 thioesterase family protein [Nocardia acididurans]
MVALFTLADGVYTPTELAASPWDQSQVSGTAICGLLARAAETHAPTGPFVPARFTVDLFRPVLAEPIQVRGAVTRDGRRVRVVDVAIVQRDEIRARATVMHLVAGLEPTGQVWQPGHELPTPERNPDRGEWDDMFLLKSGDAPWTAEFVAGLNDERKCVWHRAVPLVAGEPNSPFQIAAYVADTANMVCNWGTHGIGYINCDVTMTLSRLPAGDEVGLQAQDRVAANGVALAAATMYDRSGPLGFCVATGISNVRRPVDPAVFAAEQTSNWTSASLHS